MEKDWTDNCAACGKIIEIKDIDARADMQRSLVWHGRICQVRFLVNEELTQKDPKVQLDVWWEEKKNSLGRRQRQCHS